MIEGRDFEITARSGDFGLHQQLLDQDFPFYVAAVGKYPALMQDMFLLAVDVEDKNKILAYLSLRTYGRGSDCYYISNIETQSRFKGKGLATALLDMVLRWGEAAGAVSITVRIFRPEYGAYYQSKGFKAVGRTLLIYCYEDVETEMEKRI